MQGRLQHTSVSWRRCRIDDKDLLPLHVLSLILGWTRPLHLMQAALSAHAWRCRLFVAPRRRAVMFRRLMRSTGA
jgi:hypothetical protein